MRKIMILFVLLAIVCLAGCKEVDTSNLIENNEQQVGENFEVNEKPNLSEDENRIKSEAFEVAKKYLEIEAATEFGTPYVLKVLGMEYDKAIEENFDDRIGSVVDTGVKYSDFKNEFLKYMTKGCFSEKYGNREDYANMDGNLHIKYSGGSGYDETILSVDLISTNGDMYEFEVQYMYEVVAIEYKIMSKMNMIMTNDGLRVDKKEGFTELEEYVWDSEKGDFIIRKEK